MQYVVDNTVYKDNPTAEPKIYYLSDDKSKMVAMFDTTTDTWKRFKHPIGISSKGRKFEVLKDWDPEPDSVYFGKPEPVKQQGTPVTSSTGEIYYVDKRGDNYTCTCKGFMFRRKCRHVDQVKGKL